MPLIENLSELPTYVPPGHSGTENARLVLKEETGGQFEMVHGTLAPGGHAARHSHAEAFQAMYVLGGAADVTLGDAPARRCGPGDIVRIPPGLDHEVTSLGPEPLRLIIVYAPPISA
ncbi:MAG TPA: cupin domain-containing protein [Thermohalobaculum sp.]|nr:cupin domain-containing protein [Thermohalobaculum sp.]